MTLTKERCLEFARAARDQAAAYNKAGRADKESVALDMENSHRLAARALELKALAERGESLAPGDILAILEGRP